MLVNAHSFAFLDVYCVPPPSQKNPLECRNPDKEAQPEQTKQIKQIHYTSRVWIGRQGSSRWRLGSSRWRLGSSHWLRSGAVRASALSAQPPRAGPRQSSAWTPRKR
eukprot:scaffold1804_cov263-Pinguiococcus_pyrenoidosus.AAC.12